MSQVEAIQKDYWSTETYEAAAAFVPHFADTLVDTISFQPTDRVLDIGCGDGKFTTRFSGAVDFVLGVDSSPAMIDTAKTLDYGDARTDFRVVDCRKLDEESDLLNGNWDKVVSNAAFHWILKDPTTRTCTLQAIFQSLKPGGTFFFEMCGFGNAPEMVTSFMFSLVNHGIPIETLEEKCPWFLPSEIYMKGLLEKVGFKVQRIELKPKHLQMTDGPGGGLEGFFRLIGAQMLDLLDSEEKKNSAIEQMCRMLRYGTTREDGTQWITYSSLRCIAFKA
ncbi:hypothetical protein N7478_011140 [Penicillium angulare]|uniref:uncharacterized protein n=1 Tax=Penicillium angulare TaxID=116970 RepID=UPI00253FE5BC|nr:uncharacterized protein N7478_011140 [Penicillium angulare]KAJ5263535.1 hypothetical protein N7478_011140 [Penicillium angulare]